MPILRASTLRGRCEQCRQQFDPVYGGACTRCCRLLCAEDLHGPLWRRLLARLGAFTTPSCVRCRRRNEGASGSSGAAVS